jgi:hypothetical protein
MIAGAQPTRRGGEKPNRLCARPGCRATAVATLRFHATRREARLVDIDEGPASSGDLCARHATLVALPRGWRLDDERTPAEPTAPVPPPNGGTAPSEITDLLDAHTPMLRRAFDNVLPPD